jgi:hypothetical protein
MFLKYLAPNRMDGLGYQTKCYYDLYRFAKLLDLKIVMEYRNMDYFRYREQKFDYKKFCELFDVGDIVISDPAYIATIPEDEIYKSYLPWTDFVEGGKSDINRGPWEMSQINNMASILSAGVSSVGFGKCDGLTAVIKSRQTSALTTFTDTMFLKLKNIPQSYSKLSNVVGDCVGVHARLFNGEEEESIVADIVQPRLVSVDTYLQRMRTHKAAKFFVCTDTPSFIETCEKEFPGRIIVTERVWPKEGLGPGHALTGGKYGIENPYAALRDSYVDMLLLSKCKHLIHTPSSYFTYAAKHILGPDRLTNI